jgi:hypothetical protein
MAVKTQDSSLSIKIILDNFLFVNYILEFINLKIWQHKYSETISPIIWALNFS